MTRTFVVSYSLLWGFTVLETVVLQQLLRRTVWLRRLFMDFRSQRLHSHLPTGANAPHFSAPLLGTNQYVETWDLHGHRTILLFLSPKDASSPLYRNLDITLHGMWHKVDGHLYIVCRGSANACLKFANDHNTERFAHGRIPIILDEDALVAESFLIKGTPQAVMLDDETRVASYGRPEPDEEMVEEIPISRGQE
jgi:hypothetical protein